MVMCSLTSLFPSIIAYTDPTIENAIITNMIPILNLELAFSIFSMLQNGQWADHKVLIAPLITYRFITYLTSETGCFTVPVTRSTK